MTFVGKILVIVVVAFSLIFLGFSAVTMSTRRDWAAAIQKGQAGVSELKKKLAEVKTQAETAKKALEDTKAQFDQEKKALDTRLAALDEENKRDQTQINSAREQWAAAHEKTKGLMAEVEAKRTQTNDVRAQMAAAVKQSSDFKQHRTELTDLIRELERLLGTTAQNSSDLEGR